MLNVRIGRDCRHELQGVYETCVFAGGFNVCVATDCYIPPFLVLLCSNFLFWLNFVLGGFELDNEDFWRLSRVAAQFVGSFGFFHGVVGIGFSD